MRHLLYRSTSVIALITVLINGCRESGTHASGNNGGDDSALAQLTVAGWRLAGNTAIDSAAQPFGGVFRVVEDSQRHAYVLSAANKQIRAYDSSGTFLRTIGRSGSGPGEFRAPLSLALSNHGTVYVLDVGLFRLSEFRTDDGAFLRSAPLALTAGIPAELQVAADGRVFMEFVPLQGSPKSSHPIVAQIDPASGKRVDSAITLPPANQLQTTVRAGNTRTTTFMLAPFAAQPVWVVAPDGDVLFGDGSEYDVFRAHNGEVTTFVHVAEPASHVSEEERDSFFRAHPEVQSAEPPVSLPLEKPHFTALRLDAYGMLWLQAGIRNARQEWDIRSLKDGRRLGTMALRARARLVGISRSAVYVIVPDSDDVEFLRKLTIVR